MATEQEMQAVFDDVCRLVGRAVVMLKQTGQPVTINSIALMLQVHADQYEDEYLKRIYATAREVMKHNEQ
ncbi:DUF2767 domain-containing protein [Gibbsiella quercinecans]|uniref:DUF2767 domain-containing protein n=1 Tax=Gibbsiella quercinecans TaxID=929813 RepID=UPI002431B957|nr:DUF2767 domain-containing protein [Gibbsiella quercinecans]